jgi:cardiolipin synthase
VGVKRKQHSAEFKARVAEEALRRGVDVVVLVPAQLEQDVRVARRNPERRALFDQVAKLATYERFDVIE